jgi:hypothetical protein
LAAVLTEALFSPIATVLGQKPDPVPQLEARDHRDLADQVLCTQGGARTGRDPDGSRPVRKDMAEESCCVPEFMTVTPIVVALLLADEGWRGRVEEAQRRDPGGSRR